MLKKMIDFKQAINSQKQTLLNLKTADKILAGKGFLENMSFAFSFVRKTSLILPKDIAWDKQLERIALETKIDTQKVDEISVKTYVLVVKVVNFQKNKPIKNVNVKVFRLEKEPITLAQWTENLKNGTPFKRLILLMNTNNNGTITVELAKGFYEVEVETFSFTKVFELTQNDEALFIEPEKHWWH